MYLMPWVEKKCRIFYIVKMGSLFLWQHDVRVIT